MKAIVLSLAILFSAAPMQAATAKLWSSGTYEYDGAGNVTAIGADAYAYDSAGRLLAATVERQRGYMNGAQAYGYDPFGNLTAADSTAALRCAGGVSCGGVVRIDPNTNRIAPDLATYDDAGNLTSDGVGYEYRYDPLGMMKSQKAQTVHRQFVYTADGERIAIYSAGAWNWTLRDLGGKPLRTFTSGADPAASQWTWNEDYIYRGTSLVATEDATAGRRHVHLDHLGTPRLITDDKAAVIGHHAYLPFGTELDLAPRENPELLLKFTSHERDTIPGDIHTLDYMHARYYSAAMGRFTTVDPKLASARPAMPLSWNRYTYALNNPLKYIDANGEDVTLVVRNQVDGTSNFGHVAVRIHGKGYDYTYDFGRYRGRWGIRDSQGEGILRVWSNFKNFMTGQTKKGDVTAKTWQTSEKTDKAIMAYFNEKIAEGQKIATAADYTEYKLAEDYKLWGPNCTTMTMEAIETGAAETHAQLDGLEQVSDENDPGDVYDIITEMQRKPGKPAKKDQ